jgi:putative two-component system response regulator
MSKLLIVENSTILCGIFKRLLEQHTEFEFDIANNYAQAKEFLSKYRYEFSVVTRALPDANHGKIIALLNKHNVAPIVYTETIDEELIESFESASIVEYILRHRYDNVKYVVSRLLILKENKKRTILIAHKSQIYRTYLKQNLLYHNFKVILVDNAYEALRKLELHKNIDLLIVSNELVQVSGLEEANGLELVKKVRKLNQDSLRIISLADEPNSYLTSFFLNEGADDYLINQFSRDEFYVRVYQNLKLTD